MKIETKFSPGDTVFLMADNHVHASEVTSVHFEKYEDGSGGINYGLKDWFSVSGSKNTFNRFCEKDLFKTKQELLNSL